MFCSFHDHDREGDPAPAQIPDMRWEDMRHWVVADQTKAISEWTVRGTRDGVTFECLGCDLWEFRDGYVTKKDTYWKFKS